MVDMAATLSLIILWCSAVLGVSAVLGGLYAITAKPKLDRIENHLVRLNGSVADAVEAAAAHETEHIRHDPQWPTREPM